MRKRRERVSRRGRKRSSQCPAKEKKRKSEEIN
jgi:hypothetical protein